MEEISRGVYRSGFRSYAFGGYATTNEQSSHGVSFRDTLVPHFLNRFAWRGRRPGFAIGIPWCFIATTDDHAHILILALSKSKRIIYSSGIFCTSGTYLAQAHAVVITPTTWDHQVTYFCKLKAG